MRYDRRMICGDRKYERVGAGNEKRKRRRMYDIHVRPPVVSASQLQEWVQTEDYGKSARSLREAPQLLTLSERNPSQQGVDREEKGVWDRSEFKSVRVREDVVNKREHYSKFYNEEKKRTRF